MKQYIKSTLVILALVTISISSHNLTASPMDKAFIYAINSVICQAAVIEEGERRMYLYAASKPSGLLAVFLLRFENYENPLCKIEELPSTKRHIINLDWITWYPEGSGVIGEYIFPKFTPDDQDCFFIAPVYNDNPATIEDAFYKQLADNLPQKFTCSVRNPKVPEAPCYKHILVHDHIVGDIGYVVVTKDGKKKIILRVTGRPCGFLVLLLFNSIEYDRTILYQKEYLDPTSLIRQQNTKTYLIQLDKINWSHGESGCFMGEYIFPAFTPNNQNRYFIEHVTDSRVDPVVFCCAQVEKNFPQNIIQMLSELIKSTCVF